MKTEAGQVSVILPTYNRAHVVSRAIASVLAQTYGNLQLCVVDDGSTDHTAKLLQGVSDPRVGVIRTANHGACAALNLGIESTTGEFIAFQDSDDVWLPHKLERQIARFSQQDATTAVAVGCGWEILDGRPGRIPIDQPADYRQVLAGAPGSGGPTLLIRRLEPQPKWDLDLPSMQDRNFLIQYARRGKILFVPEVLVRVDRSGTDHIATPAATLKAYEMMLDMYGEDWQRWPDIQGLYHLRASREATILRDRKRALHHFGEARRAQRIGIGRHLEFAMGLAAGNNGLAAYTRLRGRRGYS